MTQGWKLSWRDSDGDWQRRLVIAPSRAFAMQAIAHVYPGISIEVAEADCPIIVFNDDGELLITTEAK